MKPKRCRKILDLALNKQDNSNIERNEPSTFLPSNTTSIEDTLARKLSSPLPEGAEENYQALRDIIDDEEDIEIVDCFASTPITTNLQPLQEVSILPNRLIQPPCLPIEPVVIIKNPPVEPFSGIESQITPCITYPAPLSVPDIMEPSPFNIEATASFNNSPLPCNNVIFDCINIPTPMPSPLNRHPKEKCNDVFCSEHESWKDSHCIVPVKRKSRKRKRNIADWSDVKRKELKNKGKAYINRKGNIVDQMTMRLPCNCRNKCFVKVSKSQRETIFTKFWALSSKEKQWAFVIQYTTKNQKKRCLNLSKPNNRKYTYKYYFPSNSNSLSHDKIEVCKTMFINTLSVSGKILVTAWNKYDGNSDIELDGRGRHGKKKKVLVYDMIRSVCDHVRAFEPIESHYLRDKTTKLYLDGNLNISRMFSLYKTWFDTEVYTVQAQSLRQYRDIVNENFNLGFFCPKKDQCDQCHSYHSMNNPTEEETSFFENHIKKKKIARLLKQNNKDEAIRLRESTVCAVFDFQKVLTCPFGQVSIFYYKKKLSCFNFTVYDMGKKMGICYMWDETVAKRGANEVGSCLLDFFKQNAEKGVTRFLLWSDNCSGQNRNRYVYSSYLYAASIYKVSITHRFMEKGHTQNEGDSVHATIENASRTRTVYTPNEWQLLVRWAKNSDNPYEVRAMSQNDFYDYKERVSDKVWNKNIRGQKVQWNKVKEVNVDANEPNKLQYKYDLSSDDYDTIIVASNTRNASNVSLKNCYNKPLKIPGDKYKDLISLCTTNVIPEQYHDYFRRLPYNNSMNEADPETE